MPTIFYPQLRQEANGLFSGAGWEFSPGKINSLLSLNRALPWQSTFTSVTSTNTGSFGAIITNASGGTSIYFNSKPLKAFTLAGNVTFRFWADESNNLANATIQLQIRKNLGSAIATTSYNGELTTSTAGYFITAAPTSTAFIDGDRITAQFLVIAAPGVALPTNRTVNFYLNSPTANVTGDTYLSFTETITQYDKNRFVSSTG